MHHIRHLLTVQDLKNREIDEILNEAKKLKVRWKKERKRLNLLEGKTLALLFEKPSTRTRVSFELAITQLGGNALFLKKDELQLGRGETIADTAKVLSRYVDFICARVFSHKTLEELAKHASIPVINALSDFAHPCQILGDLLTIKEEFKKLAGLRLAYIGDGNNVCNSLLIACTKVGIDIAIACPQGYEPAIRAVKWAAQNRGESGSRIEIYENPAKAAKEAHIIYTDTWVSMGNEAEREQRLRAFRHYQVNASLAKHAKKGWIFMHCLPAHRGEEVTEEIIDGPNSVVWDQAENRLHVQKAILLWLSRKRL
jgi:ornithine carbamoyltransferase